VAETVDALKVWHALTSSQPNDDAGVRP